MTAVINRLHYLGFALLLILSSFLAQTEKTKWSYLQELREVRNQLEIESQLLLFSQNLRANVRGSLLFQNSQVLELSLKQVDALIEKLKVYPTFAAELAKIQSLHDNLKRLANTRRQSESNPSQISQSLTSTESTLDLLEQNLLQKQSELQNVAQQMQINTDRLQIRSSSLLVALMLGFMSVLWLLAYQAKSKEKLNKMIEASEQLHRLIFSSMAEGLLLCTEEGVISTHNQQAAKLLGYAGKDLKGQFFYSVISKPLDENGQEYQGEKSPLHLLFKTRKPINGGVFGLRSAENGNLRWLSLSTQPLQSKLSLKNGGGYLLTMVDVTAQIQQQKTIESQRAEMTAKSKLTALGEIATGIAHEINNPLALILMETEGLQDKVMQQGQAPKDEILSFADKITSTVFKMSKIIKGIKSFARNGEQDEVSEEQLSSIIEDSLTLLKHRLSEKLIELKVEIEPEDLTLDCRPTQITQILVNLISNAVDALSELPINEENPHWIKVSAQRDGPWVNIAVENSGPKIPESIQKRLFQSFFTTKEAGKGTGLGLTLSRNLARSHQGDLYLDTKSEHTKFCFYLPQKANSNPKQNEKLQQVA